MSIDWSKAPKDATHWEPKGTEFGEGWMKKVGNQWFYWGEGDNKWFHGKLSCNVSAGREATFEPRPQEPWSGHGLPPVGTVCEWHESDGWAYTESKVVAYTDDGLFVCMQKPGRRPEVLRIDNCEFRPVRTPEQIAAEEREKAVGDMAMSIQGVPYQYPTLYALYDAGYRRQESST
ncbi:hypothetical protein ACM795_29620 [Pseudomonas aeruginosa]|uniref:hypothetical protein n=1 Tax=Pseudomonas aeruginosa TaxID=287 RepID=UPI002A6AF8ED|nr:hypothetical protein [Pseudomonas aeruginosa]MDY1143024.1 hypothetical protein [Pseudomonas aeruginosa]MDY1207942.1 hypothetical protein [Pseudomonas aeruginosa]